MAKRKLHKLSHQKFLTNIIPECVLSETEPVVYRILYQYGCKYYIDTVIKLPCWGNGSDKLYILSHHKYYTMPSHWKYREDRLALDWPARNLFSHTCPLLVTEPSLG
jgi:hypothetical protein